MTNDQEQTPNFIRNLPIEGGGGRRIRRLFFKQRGWGMSSAPLRIQRWQNGGPSSKIVRVCSDMFAYVRLFGKTRGAENDQGPKERRFRPKCVQCGPLGRLCTPFGGGAKIEDEDENDGEGAGEDTRLSTRIWWLVTRVCKALQGYTSVCKAILIF